MQSVVCGVLIGFICGFIGAGGGMMMLLILTSVLGYELKTAVGTSVFIMTFTALTGAGLPLYDRRRTGLGASGCCACCLPCCGRALQLCLPTRPPPRP